MENLRVNMAQEKTTEDKRHLRFYRNTEDTGLPFIRISEGLFRGVVFLIDTGSNDNVMFGYAYEQVQQLMSSHKETRQLYGLEGKANEVGMASCTLRFCGQDYDTSFLINEDGLAGKQLSQEMGFPIAGIIGTRFMAEHDWRIDFARQEVVIPRRDVSAKTFAKLLNK